MNHQCTCSLLKRNVVPPCGCAVLSDQLLLNLLLEFVVGWPLSQLLGHLLAASCKTVNPKEVRWILGWSMVHPKEVTRRAVKSNLDLRVLTKVYSFIIS